MRHTLKPLVPGLAALNLLLLVGCTAPQVSHRLLEAPKAGGPVSMFGQASGTGAVSIRIVDHRPRQIQSFTDADAFNGVYFRLSNTVKLKSSLAIARSTLGPGTPTYSAVFPAIPADTGGNYTLSVGLFRNITTPSSTSDPGYNDFLNKVGEGASNSIIIAPGENKTITITINAVGDFVVDSPTIHVNSASPVLMSGESPIVDTRVNFANNPGTDMVSVYLTDLSNIPVAGATMSVANIASPSTVVVNSMPMPYVATTQTYRLVVENSGNTASGSYVLSRRTRDVTVEATASIGTVTMN